MTSSRLGGSADRDPGFAVLRASHRGVVVVGQVIRPDLPPPRCDGRLDEQLSIRWVFHQAVGGLWAVGCGLWAVGCGLWAVGCGLWAVGCGLWAVGCGLWAVGCGLWAVLTL